MFSVKKAVTIFMAWLTALAFTGTGHAIYFTLQLKNGNEIITDQYSEEANGTIHFYTNEGAVSIPKSTIKSIVSNDGSIALDIEDEQKKAINQVYPNEYPEDEAAAEPKEQSTDKERLNSIKDQLFVINANLENLARNKNIFISQQEQLQQQKQKSEERIKSLQKSPDADMRGTQDAIVLEQTKVKDIETKLADLEQRINNNAQIYEAQQRIKERFEADLAKIKQP